MKCTHETPPNSLVVDENGIVKHGVGCYRVLIGGMCQPECSGILTPASLVKHGIYKCTKYGFTISKFKEEL